MLESRSHLTGVPLRSLALAFVAGLLVWLAAVAVGAHVRAASPGSADLSLHVETDRTVVPVGEDFTHTLTITNDGPDDAGGVVVAAPLPASWIFASAAPAADYDPENGNWDVGALASGESKVLQIVATMHGLGLLNVDVEVTTSDTGDPDSTPGNCCSGRTTRPPSGSPGRWRRISRWTWWSTIRRRASEAT